jgi:hypothetical protein
MEVALRLAFRPDDVTLDDPAYSTEVRQAAAGGK